jgi:cytochrome oxidase Cu insertion factor (SCO1/SenC/PrrC family)
MEGRLRSGESIAVVTLGILLGVTAGWWALALWPLPSDTPEWLTRTRSVCFNTTESGLPDASGWILLIGQPVGMVAVLMAGWGESVRRGLRGLAASRPGRALLIGVAASVALGVGAAGVRVVSATSAGPWRIADGLPPASYPRLDWDAPPLGLVDQFGETLDLERLKGRPALVTFAFGQCGTICPMIVRDVLETQARVRRKAEAGEVDAERIPRVVVVTLDPWRDTPSRLPYLAEFWKIGEDGYVLSAGVDDVTRVLDAWNVARDRDLDTGDVLHPLLTYVLDASGRIAFASSGGVAALTELVDRS